MAKKRKKPSMSDDLKDSASKIWLAGLGALDMAETESSKLFSTLVDKGRAAVGEGGTVEMFKKAAGKASGRARAKADESWDWLGDTIEDRVTSTLEKLGLATQHEIQDLSRKVESLNKELAKARKPAAKKSAAKKSAAKKPARKKAAAKKKTKKKSSKR